MYEFAADEEPSEVLSAFQDTLDPVPNIRHIFISTLSLECTGCESAGGKEETGPDLPAVLH